MSRATTLGRLYSFPASQSPTLKPYLSPHSSSSHLPLSLSRVSTSNSCLHNMKTRVRSSGLESSPPAPSFYKYLKPGELAQLRYSKITARSKQIGAQTLLALCQLESSSDSAFSQPHLAMDGLPCFNFRVKTFPRCLQRKKLLAVTPFFSETQT